MNQPQAIPLAPGLWKNFYGKISWSSRKLVPGTKKFGTDAAVNHLNIPNYIPKSLSFRSSSKYFHKNQRNGLLADKIFSLIDKELCISNLFLKLYLGSKNKIVDKVAAFYLHEESIESLYFIITFEGLFNK